MIKMPQEDNQHNIDGSSENCWPTSSWSLRSAASFKSRCATSILRRITSDMLSRYCRAGRGEEGEALKHFLGSCFDLCTCILKRQRWTLSHTVILSVWEREEWHTTHYGCENPTKKQELLAPGKDWIHNLRISAPMLWSIFYQHDFWTKLRSSISREQRATQIAYQSRRKGTHSGRVF